MERATWLGDTMSATVPTPPIPTDEPEVAILPAPRELVAEYLRLVEERRAVEERLAFVRAELELLAASSLSARTPRGRFESPRGAVAARLSSTCVFDRAAVARELQRMGKLADVAVIQGPGLARYLAREPVVAARLGDFVRMRKSIMLMAADP